MVFKISIPVTAPVFLINDPRPLTLFYKSPKINDPLDSDQGISFRFIVGLHQIVK
jgi:hypothetical protein